MSDELLYTSRRDFLTGGLTLLSAAGTIPVFLGHTARALAGPESGSPHGGDAGRILVVIQLAGGNDGLNTVVPYDNDLYYKNRPRIGVAQRDVHKLEKNVGLHPAARGLRELFDDGRMAIVQGVGYPNPNRSHFVSMDIWHTADPELRHREGWIGRYFDACCNGAAPDPLRGVALTQEAPLAMRGDAFSPLAFENPDTLTWRLGRRDRRAQRVFRKLNNSDGDLPTSGRRLEQYLQRAALDALVGADEIRSAAGNELSGGAHGSLSRALRLVARMIAADLPTRIYYVSLGGFDTHTNQEGRHRRLLEQFGDAVKEFLARLRRDKLLDRVLVMSFSEFGRRVKENASGGTDHGAAAPMFLFGSRLHAGVHERHPSLSRLDRGDLAFGCDFRRVYATVLRDWLDTDPRAIVGPAFHPLRLIKR